MEILKKLNEFGYDNIIAIVVLVFLLIILWRASFSLIKNWKPTPEDQVKYQSDNPPVQNEK